MTRLYHGSATHGRTTGKAWFSTNRNYAANYRPNAELQYVDYPTDKVNAALDPDNYGQTVERGFTWNVELDSTETGPRKILTPPTAPPAVKPTRRARAAAPTPAAPTPPTPAEPPAPKPPPPRDERSERELQEDFEAAQRWTSLRRNIDELPEYGSLSTESKQKTRRLNRTGDLTSESALRIAQDDEINRGSPLRSLETVEAKVGANTARLAKLLGPKLYGSPETMPAVTQKVLFQNAFDAVKEALESGDIAKGRIQIRYDQNKRTIQIIDNGAGMPASVMGKEFLEIAGTKKGTERASGGFGIAKMQFLFGNKQLEVVSLRDGRLAQMTTTGPDLFSALDGTVPPPTIEVTNNPIEIEQATNTLFPDGHGTSVTVTIPETYVDESTGDTLPIKFTTYQLEEDDSLLRSPLFANVDVTTQDLRYGSFVNTQPIGANFPTDKYTLNSSGPTNCLIKFVEAFPWD
jgi:hypothetical protein